MSTREQAPAPRTYFGWQTEKVNFLFGLTASRTLMLVAAALLAAWPVGVGDVGLGLVCWPVALLLGVCAFIRFAGRTADEWIAAWATYHFGRVLNHHKFTGGPFTPGHTLVEAVAVDEDTEPGESGQDADEPGVSSMVDPDASENSDGEGDERERRPLRAFTQRLLRHRRVDLPGVLAPLEILEGERLHNNEALAIVRHRIDNTYTAVAAVRFPGIGLVDSDRREARVAGWGGLLAGLCAEGSPIVRVQAMQRLLPESGAALRRWHADHLADDAPAIAREVNEQLLSTATQATAQRETYLAFTLDAKKAAHQIKQAGGGSAGAMVVLGRHLRSLTSSIGAADLQVDYWLTPRGLGEAIRTAYDPHSSRLMAERRVATAGLEPGVEPGAAGPAAAEAHPGHYSHDGAYSATYWVYEWPRSQTHATVLAPLLGEGEHRRSYSMHVEPLAPREAEREVMRERTARDVAVRMREKAGQVIPEHERVALERAVAQDAERAAGHGLVRFNAYLTVTVDDLDELEKACAELEADASAARIEVRRMWYGQDIGFAAAALPLGFGLPRKRW
ncbi:SCO6880 family protein [Glycomyces salinus]|uniref:SCO6880 family protein n=1 Tax=Glycomyces salinus TaxID=980294 RepID=UPI0018EC70F3|nr:SCO6880 family protein [Glycomyces salinus]